MIVVDLQLLGQLIQADLHALIAAGSRNLERARLTGYAKQACAPESDAKRLKTNLAAEIVWIIVLNLLFAAGLWYLRKQ